MRREVKKNYATARRLLQNRIGKSDLRGAA
jgi:hypothetical protein